MLSLHEESIYLRGARDILLRLQDDFDMYLIPCGKFYSKTDNGKYEYFPISNNRTRKLIGSALVEALLSRREQLSRFLQGNYKELQINGVERKKDKVVKIEIEVV